MFRVGARAALRSQTSSSLAPARTATKRFLTTEPPHLKSRSWKNSALRWGLAAAGIYYYNTSSVFAEYPQNNLLNPNVDAIDEEKEHPTIDRLLESSKNKAQKKASVLQSAVESASDKALEQTAAVHGGPSPGEDGPDAVPATSGAADLEAEAQGEGAFNPVTGEINWDCPCLGGMAYGPCGEEFRAAFSCFVYSTEEPKGMDCIEKFGAMQECFRAHPEHYKGELEDDEALDEGLAAEKEELNREIEERKQQVAAAQGQRRLLEEPEPVESATEQKPKPGKKSKKTSDSSKSTRSEKKTTSDSPSELSSDNELEHGSSSSTVRQPKPPAVSSEAVPESEQLVPKAAHDATDVASGQSHSHAN